MCCCCVFAWGEPVSPRPDVTIASLMAVEPRPFLRDGSAPPSSSARTAAAQRLRTARCKGVTPPMSTAFGSAPAAISRVMVSACFAGVPPSSGRVAVCRVVQRLGAAAVPSCDVRTTSEEQFDDVRAICGGGEMEGGVTSVDVMPDSADKVLGHTVGRGRSFDARRDQRGRRRGQARHRG